jgi:hypothetical protein
VLRSELTHEDGRLLATAIGSFSIFPETRLSERRPRRGFQSPEPG